MMNKFYHGMSRCCFFMLFVVTSATLHAQQKISIIPQPVSLQQKDGAFILDAKTNIRFKSARQDLKAAAVFFSACIKNIGGFALPFNGTTTKSVQLVLSNVKDIGDEGYLLTVSPVAIVITANSKAGIVYAMQTIFQLLPAVRTNAQLQIPCMEITDYPRFKWRGMHLDVSRHFFSPEAVKEYIDLMANYKMNTFHWHLTDDPGWRIEIKKYPLLTAVGAWRVNDAGIGWGAATPLNVAFQSPYGGFYTQHQVKEIIQYAAERNIEGSPAWLFADELVVN